MYRRVVLDSRVDDVAKVVCKDIESRSQIKFLEIGTDNEHIHFLLQSVPTSRVTKIGAMIKSLTAREVYKRGLHAEKKLWGVEFSTDGYFR